MQHLPKAMSKANNLNIVDTTEHEDQRARCRVRLSQRSGRPLLPGANGVAGGEGGGLTLVQNSITNGNGHLAAEYLSSAYSTEDFVYRLMR
jgi:hypothetical protein